MLHKYPEPAYRKSPNGKYFVVYNKTNGKILKNRDY